MKISFIGEWNEETRFGSIQFRYDDLVISFFENRNYGTGINKICFCPVCRPKELELKQRVRMDNKTKTFYFDIMYDYDYWVSADTVGREADFFTGFRQIIPFLEKRKIKDFDLESFKKDLEIFLAEYI